jgi:hypothetical protein
MEYSVELEKLPAEVRFPQRLENRVRFDAARRRLYFQGFMTKCMYDELSALSGDVVYHRALEQLFVLTSAEVSGGRPPRRVPAGALIAIAATALVALGGAWAAWRHSSAGGATASPSEVHVSAVAR